MIVLNTIPEIRQRLNDYRMAPVGFVPTMGALHEGHISLVSRATSECPVVVVSIFVNPTQFNDRNDLVNYPRTLDSDLGMLAAELRDEDIVFTPEVSEMYPVEDAREFSFGNLDNVMEASHRPGHFNGVGQIVSKLFDAVKPDRAYFGLKDFQQVAVIRALVKQIGSSVEIISCPIVREKDGLAMSSRNRLLEPEIRQLAPCIYKTLSAAAGMITFNEINEIQEFVKDEINRMPGFSLEYFEIADDIELIPVNSTKEMIHGRKYYGCIAVKAGKIRLIDNIQLTG